MHEEVKVNLYICWGERDRQWKTFPDLSPKVSLTSGWMADMEWKENNKEKSKGALINTILSCIRTWQFL